jgi:hypothetical protein
MSTSSDDDERRRQYLQGYADSVDRHRNSASTYESRANEFATNAIKALTYLNGGGLVAIPTVVALFGADPKQAKFELLKAAIFFVIGLFAAQQVQGKAADPGQACLHRPPLTLLHGGVRFHARSVPRAQAADPDVASVFRVARPARDRRSRRPR